jgi:hypothetical protein
MPVMRRVRAPRWRGAMLLVAASVVASAYLTGCQPSPGVPSGASTTESHIPQGAPSGTATLEGGVQRIAVDVSKGYFDPTVIKAKAGLPIEITFGQGQGCLAQVQFPDQGVEQDLTQGGGVVKLPALEPGTYSFSCGMQMVFGELVIE